MDAETPALSRLSPDYSAVCKDAPPVIFMMRNGRPLRSDVVSRIQDIWERAVREQRPVVIDGTLSLFQLIDGEWREIKPSNAED